MNSDIEEYIDSDEEATTSDPRKENSEIFFKLRDEELRALTSNKLSEGAKVQFCLLSKLSWFPQCGGFYKGKKGAIAISIRELARYMHCDPKSPGRWTKQLTDGNFLWVGKHRLPNARALNVYYFSCLHSREVQQALPWMEGAWGPVGNLPTAQNEASENSNNGNSAKTTIGNGANGHLPVSENGHSQPPKTDTGNTRKRALAVSENGHSLSPSSPLGVGKKPTGSHQNGTLPVPKNGNGQSAKTDLLKKNGDTVESLEANCGEALTPQQAKFRKRIDGMWDTKLDKLEAELLEQKREADPADKEGLAGLNWRLAEIKRERQGGKPPAKRKPAAPAAPAAPKAPEQKLKGLGASMRAAVLEASR